MLAGIQIALWLTYNAEDSTGLMVWNPLIGS
jgi:hypothetical protein